MRTGITHIPKDIDWERIRHEADFYGIELDVVREKTSDRIFDSWEEWHDLLVEINVPSPPTRSYENTSTTDQLHYLTSICVIRWVGASFPPPKSP